MEKFEEQVTLLFGMIEQVVDDCILNHRYNFKMYEFLTDNKFTKHQVTEFINSSAAANVSQTVDDLDLYLEGGHPEVREAYPEFSKPEARKARNYLYSILEDAWKYEIDKGKRKRRRTVNK